MSRASGQGRRARRAASPPSRHRPQPRPSADPALCAERLAPRPPVRDRADHRGHRAHPGHRLPRPVRRRPDPRSAGQPAAALVPARRCRAAQRVGGHGHGLADRARRRHRALDRAARPGRWLAAESAQAVRSRHRAEPGHHPGAAADQRRHLDVRRLRPAADDRAEPVRDHPGRGVPRPVRPGAALDRAAVAGHAQRLRTDHVVAAVAGQLPRRRQHARHRVLAAGGHGGAVHHRLRGHRAAGARGQAPAGPGRPADRLQPGAHLGRRGHRPQRGAVGDVRRGRDHADAQEPVRGRSRHRAGRLRQAEHRHLGSGDAVGVPAGTEEGRAALPGHDHPDGAGVRGVAAERLLPGAAQRLVRLGRLLGEPGLPVPRPVPGRTGSPRSSSG